MLFAEQINKRTFYRNGAFANTKMYRKMKGGSWRYYWRHDL